jgi:hypothetical protein
MSDTRPGGSGSEQSRSGESAERERVVPEHEWASALSRYAEEHGQSRVYVEIEDPDGGRQHVAPEKDFELSLVDLARTDRAGAVRIVLHKHPGARIETLEIDAPVQIVQRGDALSVKAEGGRRVRIEPIPPEPSRS